MSQFIVDCTTLAALEKCVSRVMAAPDYTGKGPYEAYQRCGCGAGGTCANSCVSGCAERGGCGPHGAR